MGGWPDVPSPPTPAAPGLTVWSVVFTVGLNLIALAVLFEALVDYEFVAGDIGALLHTGTLYSASSQLLVGGGMVLMGVGWTGEQAVRLGGFRRPPGAPPLGARRVAGTLTFLVGIGLAAVWGFVQGWVTLAEYYGQSLHLWQWTSVAIEVGLGVGIILLATGRFVYRSATDLPATAP